MNRIVLPVTVEVDGVRLSRFYAVQSNMVTVWHALLGSRSQAICGSLASSDVENLLVELYQAKRTRMRSISMVHG
jgi:hypothetical protein